ncbi:RNA polymerase sigma factor [uncultured Pseudokineococcus sp.]|uniref:RNA polymerase sigma factor n=1 Tax=uncultured Pseudokineococcus sp. TaxID=1642928 RepID=UPI00261F36BB|nr:sigma-70 family RNA polymerase sigma factor [uncultured Pseudokineococcus sp.]
MDADGTAQGDAALVALAREGCGGGFEELVRRHQTRAHTLAVRMLGDRHEAADVVQEAFVKAWTGLPRFDDRAAFSTWLYRIVVRESIDQQRRRARRPLPVEQDVERPATDRTDALVEQRVREDAVRRAVRALPEDQRAALVLTAFLDLEHAEAAEVLETTPDAVRGRAARARRALMREMGEWA